jgi:hypothetical protein
MEKGTGAFESRYDIRTFSFPTRSYTNVVGGMKYEPGDIEDQSRVGICTAISLTQNAAKATGIKYSADFQYLLQKLYVDKNWTEGSSILSALKVAKKYGLLPEKYWTHTVQSDRDLNYEYYIEKLKVMPESELQRLLLISNGYKIKAYASVPVNRDDMAQAINESKAGILTRYDVGQDWWSDSIGNVSWKKEAIEPLRPSKKIISGHAVTDTNYRGNSFRIANSWGKEWADGGTAYRYQTGYAPTECWAIFYNTETPIEIKKQLENRNKILGQILDLVQKVLDLLRS